jgi:hypothetical protein
MDKMNTCCSAIHAVNAMNKGNLKDEIPKQNYEIREVVQDYLLLNVQKALSSTEDQYLND